MRPQTGLRLLAGAVCVGTAIAPIVVSVDGAYGAAAACFGLTATITASDENRVRGTEGDDVIVAEDVSHVEAGGGDDAICVTGPARIEAGDGNDRVQSHSPAGTKNVVILGSGSDLFEGSNADDDVYAEQTRVDSDTGGGLEPFPGTGTENTDVVHTRGGGDRVNSGAPDDTEPNEDEVDLGSGDDTVWMVPWLGGDARVSGGPGSDWFSLRDALRDAVAVSIDLSAGTAAADGVQFSTALGFENVDTIHSSPDPSSTLDVRGNDAPNTIVALGFYLAHVSVETGAGADDVIGGLAIGKGDHPGRVDVRAGSGDDDVDARASGSADFPGRVSVRGGSGDDHLDLEGDPEAVVGGPGRDTVDMRGYGDLRNEPVVYDLAHERFTRGDVIAQFETERLVVHASQSPTAHVSIIGTGGRDVITAGDCGTRVRGAGGDDLLRSTSEGCDGIATTFYGNAGDDVLRGALGRDVLLGGTGTDRAFGGASLDRCRAEFARGCERT